MIYIASTADNDSAIYFDIHSVERQGRDLRISGTIGDDSYEGEVAVEVGRSESVTFADAWLGGEGFREFLDRCCSISLENALLDSVRNVPFHQARRMQPHGRRIKTGADLARESEPVWQTHA